MAESMQWPDLDPDAVAIRWVWAAYDDARRVAAEAYWRFLEEEGSRRFPEDGGSFLERLFPRGAAFDSQVAAWYETLLEGLCYGNEGGTVEILYVHPDGDGVMVFVPLPEHLKPVPRQEVADG